MAVIRNNLKKNSKTSKHFPLEEIKFYVVSDGAGRTLMLPGEY